MSVTDDPPAPAPTEPPVRRGRAIGPVGLLLITAFAAVVALGFIWLVLGRGSSDAVDIQDALDHTAAAPVVPEGASTAEIGATAPDVRLDYLDGGTQQLADLRGSPVVLNFWSSTCAPCLQEMPAIDQVARSAKGAVTVVGVDVTDTEAAGKQMVTRTGVTYRNARDPGGDVLAVFGAAALPHTVLIDARGKVVDTHSGALTAGELTALLRRNGLTG
jgi:peroxiredoxin